MGSFQRFGGKEGLKWGQTSLTAGICRKTLASNALTPTPASAAALHKYVLCFCFCVFLACGFCWIDYYVLTRTSGDDRTLHNL